MDWMRSCCAISGFSSILILTSFTAPLAASTAASSDGPSVLQGPHHGAQKSTITGTSRLAVMTSAAKVASPESLMCGLAPLAALLAGWEVTGRPPGPISAMACSFRGLRPERWWFGTLNGSPGKSSLQKAEKRRDAQFHDQGQHHGGRPDIQPDGEQQPRQPAEYHQSSK